MTSTMQRLAEWVTYWQGQGFPEDAGPARPDDVSEYHDKQLREIAHTVAGIKRMRNG